MSASVLIPALLAAGRAEDYASIATIAGAGVHAQVLRFSTSLREGDGLREIERLAPADRKAFAKALAVYENSVGGLGSVTALRFVLPLVDDDGHSLLDWVLTHTRSYWYYSHSAKSFTELQAIQAAHSVRSELNRQIESQRQAVATVRRREKASANLFNAVRRGDKDAVAALLSQGATAHGTTPDGQTLAEFADGIGNIEIAALLRQAQGGTGTV
jgi:hypothetical protein